MRNLAPFPKICNSFFQRAIVPFSEQQNVTETEEQLDEPLQRDDAEGRNPSSLNSRPFLGDSGWIDDSGSSPCDAHFLSTLCPCYGPPSTPSPPAPRRSPLSHVYQAEISNDLSSLESVQEFCMSPKRRYRLSYLHSSFSSNSSLSSSLLAPAAFSFLPSNRERFTAIETGSPTDPLIPKYVAVCIDPNLRPLQPEPNDEESIRIYREHVQESYNYLRIKAELSLLIEREKELTEIGSPSEIDGEIEESLDVDEEYEQALKDYEALLKFKNCLEVQIYE